MKKLLYIVVAIVAVVAVVWAFSGKSNATKNNALIAYFSATGNTAGVAQNLAAATGADLFEIQPMAAYTAEDLDWRNDKSRASVEMNDRSSRPEIASRVENMDQYNIVFVGFPIWWGREPSIIDTFLESYDFNGKTIVPFATSGSTPSTDEAAESIRAIVPGANVMNGARFPNDVSADELKTWAGEWLK
ncbi:MAG: NAD(P)H-dependent oxidoreductase [Alphaproteobacteria bacterium]|nr:NAD(P)H-dependent oxidoreductase [Alphaproteobacteria bacterium]